MGGHDLQRQVDKEGRFFWFEKVCRVFEPLSAEKAKECVQAK